MALLEEFLSLTVLTNKYIPVTPSIKQAQMLVAQEDELLYGGAAGGGKSAGILACALQYAFMPDYHAILLRRSFADLMQPKALIPLSMQWLYKTDAKWRGQEHRWYFPSGATLTFGYMDTEKDKYQYQGPAFNFCVGKGTLVQMADGSELAIESLVVGDSVRTLEGPKKVTRVYEPRFKQSVEVFADGFSQIQSLGHSLLTSAGWASSHTFGVSPLCGSFSPTSFRSCGKYGVPSLRTFQSHLPHPAIERSGLTQPSKRRQWPLDRQSSLDFCVCMVPQDRGSGCVTYLCERGASVPHISGPLMQDVFQPPPGQYFSGLPQKELVDEDLSGPNATSPQDYSDDCYCGNRRYGERAPPSVNLVLVCLPRQFCAAQQNPNGSEADDLDKTQTHSHQVWSWDHPYTMEKHQTSEAHRVSSFQFLNVGIKELYDITVEGASHYITRGGFINKNCGFDELTQFSETMYSYMFSRLRRGAEMKIPCRMRATANPGGEGHDWVNARFRPTKFPGRGRTTTDPETGAKMTCIFIPSKLEDNPHIDHAAYRLSLAQLDPVTRSQLEHGDWDIKPEGNMFKREWFTRTARPTEQLELMVRAWDLAATPPTAKNPDPDWAVGVKMGRGKSGKYYVMDVVRTRGTPQTIYNLVCDTAEYDGVETTVHIEQEPGSAGKMVVDDFIRKLAGYAVYATKPTGDKITRARPLSAACSRGDVILVDGLWNKAYLDVMCPFPDGSHDDDVDATAHAFESLHEMYRPITNWGAATIG